jgi:hypothetical protein
MPTFSGKFQYLNPDGTPVQAGPCKVTFEAETLTLVPGSGAPIALDLGDIDVFVPGDYELTLTLYTGKRILLNQFGKTFQNLCHDLLEAYRRRLVQCLLLEDLEEISRFDGFARLDSPTRTFSSPAEFRLYKSNLALLPTQATGFQWRLADIDTVSFDEANYAVVLASAGERLAITKLAKRTREFHERLQESTSQLAQKGAETLHALFPFLDPDQFQQVALLMKEGRAAPLARLRAIHAKTEQALAGNVVDTTLKPYFEALMSHTPAGWLYAGFKLLRKDEGEGETEGQEQQEQAPEEAGATPESTGEGASEETPEEAADQPLAEAGVEKPGEEEQPILHWFFFPLAAKPGAGLPSNLVAWEATSRSGRATYFFRLVPPEQAGLLQDAAKAPGLVDTAIRQLNHAIVLLNFRREPIYLPDDSLEIQPRFRRYAIACRKIAELRRLRASFLGRAIHTSPQAWEKQLAGFLTKA